MHSLLVIQIIDLCEWSRYINYNCMVSLQYVRAVQHTFWHKPHLFDLFVVSMFVVISFKKNTHLLLLKCVMCFRAPQQKIQKRNGLCRSPTRYLAIYCISTSEFHLSWRVPSYINRSELWSLFSDTTIAVHGSCHCVLMPGIVVLPDKVRPNTPNCLQHINQPVECSHTCRLFV